jgi:hypothetical protein
MTKGILFHFTLKIKLAIVGAIVVVLVLFVATNNFSIYSGCIVLGGLPFFMKFGFGMERKTKLQRMQQPTLALIVLC